MSNIWVNFRSSIMKKLWDLALHENLVNIQFYNTLCIQALCAAYKTRFLGKFFLLMPRFTTCVWPPHHQRATVIYSFKYHSKIRRPKWNKIIDTPSLLGWDSFENGSKCPIVKHPKYFWKSFKITEEGRSVTTFYYYSVNHQSGLHRLIFKIIIYFLIHQNVPQIMSFHLRYMMFS